MTDASYSEHVTATVRFECPQKLDKILLALKGRSPQYSASSGRGSPFHSLGLNIPMLRKLHLITGLTGVVAFVLTGQYMHWVYHHLRGMPDGPRLLFRTSHIYLLWSSLLNLAIGCYLTTPTDSAIKKIRALGSAALLFGPYLLCWSFFSESQSLTLARPVCRSAICLAAAGVLLHLLTSFASKAGGTQNR